MLAVAPRLSSSRTAQPIVEWVTEPLAVENLRQEWNELLQASESDCLFLTWEWLSTWWKHLAGDRALSLVLVRIDGRLVALAPFGLRRSSIWNGHPYPVIEFLGNGFVGSDYLDIVIRRGYEDAVSPILASTLGARSAMYKWTQLRRRQCAAASLGAGLRARGWTVRESGTNLCPFVRIAGHSWESYLQTVSSQHRYNFQRKWKRLNQCFAVSFDQVVSAHECRPGVELVVKQHTQRWSNRGSSDAFHLPELVQFHNDLAPLAFQRDWLRLYVLRLDGRPAASIYAFSYHRKFYFYQSGFDPDYERYSVGLIAMGLSIQKAIEEGAIEYDLLHGSESYKRHWTRESRELGRLALYPPGAAGRIYSDVIELARVCNGAVRRLRRTGVV